MSTTDIDMDTLTPEERAAIDDGGGVPGPEESAAAEGDDAPDTPGSDEDNGEDEEEQPPSSAESEADATVGGDSVEDPAAEAREGDGPSPQSEAAAPFVPQYSAELPGDYAEQVAAMNGEARDLSERFRAGEIDVDEFSVAQAELQARREQLTAARIKAEIAAEMQSQTEEQQWARTVQQFVQSVKTNIDYSEDKEKQADLDLFVRRLADDPKNSDRPMDWFLREAHRRVQALHGVVPAAAAPAVAPDKRRAAPVGTIPKTLAQVPGSDGPGDVGDEFSDIDALEGLELEDALRKMTDSQRAKYAMAGR